MLFSNQLLGHAVLSEPWIKDGNTSAKLWELNIAWYEIWYRQDDIHSVKLRWICWYVGLFKSTCLNIVGVNHWNKMYEKRIWGFHFLCIILSQKSNKVGVCKFLTHEVGKYSFSFFFYKWQYCPEGSLLMPERPLLLNKSRNPNGTISWTVLLCTEILLHHQRHLFIIIIIVIITMITIITSTTINVWV